MTRDLLATMQIVGMYLPKTENCVVENLFMNYMINLSNKQNRIQKVKIFYNICMWMSCKALHIEATII